MILEVCGFNDWLIEMLKEYGCGELILIQPEKRSKKKTDRRDANSLGEKAWYGRIKKRRGSKIARVAVMRRLATIIWQMLKHNEPYTMALPENLWVD